MSGKPLFVLLLCALIAAGSFAACANQTRPVYGPPPDDVMRENYVPYPPQPQPFDPADNIPQGVYGPPSMGLEED